MTLIHVYNHIAENLREYVTVMICVAVNGQPTIGVIHKPFEKKTGNNWIALEFVRLLIFFKFFPLLFYVHTDFTQV